MVRKTNNTKQKSSVEARLPVSSRCEGYKKQKKSFNTQCVSTIRQNKRKNDAITKQQKEPPLQNVRNLDENDGAQSRENQDPQKGNTSSGMEGRREGVMSALAGPSTTDDIHIVNGIINDVVENICQDEDSDSDALDEDEDEIGQDATKGQVRTTYSGNDTTTGDSFGILWKQTPF